MKSVIWIFAGLLITAGVAALVLRQTTHDPHLREVAYAAGITLVSAMLSMIPMFLARHSEPVVVFQAGFGGTVIHLFVTLAMGAAVHFLQVVGDRRIFVFLLLAFYWFSLLFLVIAMITIFRQKFPKTPTRAILDTKNA